MSNLNHHHIWKRCITIIYTTIKLYASYNATTTGAKGWTTSTEKWGNKIIIEAKKRKNSVILRFLKANSKHTHYTRGYEIKFSFVNPCTILICYRSSKREIFLDVIIASFLIRYFLFGKRFTVKKVGWKYVDARYMEPTDFALVLIGLLAQQWCSRFCLEKLLLPKIEGNHVFYGRYQEQSATILLNDGREIWDLLAV